MKKQQKLQDFQNELNKILNSKPKPKTVQRQASYDVSAFKTISFDSQLSTLKKNQLNLDFKKELQQKIEKFKSIDKILGHRSATPKVQGSLQINFDNFQKSRDTSSQYVTPKKKSFDLKSETDQKPQSPQTKVAAPN